MVFNLRQLDGLDYDDVEPLLEGYIDDAIARFLDSAPGQAYTQQSSEAGSWAATFIEMAYLYGEMTLPRMAKGDVQVVMEQILPRKLTLTAPEQADDAIPELVAFWTFLKQDYNLRSAAAIIKYLNSIQDKFPRWMFDPARGGIAKTFMLQGMQAGYDMTDPEEMKAFQTVYNQNLPESPVPAIAQSPEAVPMPATPPEILALMGELGVAVPKAGEMVNPQAFLGGILTALQQKQAELQAQAPETVELNSAPNADSRPNTDFSSSLQHSVVQPEAIQLSPKAIALLQAQTITDTAPGTILQDFQMLLDAIGPEGLSTSSKRQQLPLKLLPDLNQRLCKPIAIALKRPQQISFPPLNGLYLLLRATGLLRVEVRGKSHRLMLNPDILDSWQRLNPTERYFTLLEAWFVRSRGEMLGGDRLGFKDDGYRAIPLWEWIKSSRYHVISNSSEQQTLSYRSGYHTFALMELFGLLEIQLGKPEPNKGWCIRRIAALPWGNALMEVMQKAYFSGRIQLDPVCDFTRPLNELQPLFQPYFPEWQQILSSPSLDFRSGRHIFKVSLGNQWSRIAIAGEATLDVLSGLILDAVGFDNDHLDMFTYTDLVGCKVEVGHPYADCDWSTEEVQIGSLPLQEGSVMEYLFDFGASWKFRVVLECIEPEKSPEESLQTSKWVGEILDVHGQAPEQYPNYDEEW